MAAALRVERLGLRASAMRRSASLNASTEDGSKMKPLERCSKEFSVFSLQSSASAFSPD